MNKMFADREHLGSQSHHGIMGDLHSAQLISPMETPLPGCPISHPLIRPLCGPGLPIRGFYFRVCCKKRCSFTHFFQEHTFRGIYAKRGDFL